MLESIISCFEFESQYFLKNVCNLISVLGREHFHLCNFGFRLTERVITHYIITNKMSVDH